MVVPLSAWLSDRFGPARTYNVALLAFAAGSALCGLAWNLESMVVFRIIQAIPGGILPVVTLSMVYRIVPREKIGAAMGMYGLGIIVAPAIGPTLGGYLVEYVDWRLIFFINVPIGILGAIAAVMVLPQVPRREVAEVRRARASSPSRAGCSRCCWRSRRARTGAGPATASSACCPPR